MKNRSFSSFFILMLAGCNQGNDPTIASSHFPADCAHSQDGENICLTTFDSIHSNLNGYDKKTVVLNGYLVIDQGVLSLYANQEAYQHRMVEGNIIIIRAPSNVQNDVFNKYGYRHVRIYGKFHANESSPLSRHEMGFIKEELNVSQLPDRSEAAAREDWSDIKINIDDLK